MSAEKTQEQDIVLGSLGCIVCVCMRTRARVCSVMTYISEGRC